MKIYVSVKANAKNEKVEKLDETHYKVSVNAPPKEGKANKAVADALSEFLGISKINIALAGGAMSKEKIFEIDDIWNSKKKFFESSEKFRKARF
ncbi:MAG: DUF167 domain-containing protein [Patescibacteria group bacterium]